LSAAVGALTRLLDTEGSAACAFDAQKPQVVSADVRMPSNTQPRTLAGVTSFDHDSPSAQASIDLYWLPLGAGGHSVRFNGRVYEALAARLQRRCTHDLYHSALAVEVPGGRFVIETAPIRTGDDPQRGVVGEGAVGARWAGRFRIFRYELRCWRNGVIPDIGEAVESPRRLSNEPDQASRLLRLVPQVPRPVWGRDDLRTGEMWNSNSVIAWLIARTGLDAHAIHPPVGGRAPGWNAGLVVAQRSATKVLEVAPGPGSRHAALTRRGNNGETSTNGRNGDALLLTGRGLVSAQPSKRSDARNPRRDRSSAQDSESRRERRFR
jgi:hypothetical protein